MPQAETYIDVYGNPIPLTPLDAEERGLVARLRRRARTNPDWNAFDNYWTRAVAAFYEARGYCRARKRQTAVYRIAQDLSGRIALAAGLARMPDYRDELEDLIRKQFPTRRAFCKATGIAEDLLSHVLAGRKDLSLATLTKGLERIGYTLRIAPTTPTKRTG